MGTGVGQRAQREGRPVVTPEIAAAAAVWVARLHGPDRSPRMEREFLAWQARSAAHRLAFERCTDTWQDVAGLTLSTYAHAVSAGAPARESQRAGRLDRRGWALAALVALVVGGVLVQQPWQAADAYATRVGEQRLVILQDGTRLSLNTATRVRVDLGAAQRTVHLEEGEALFEVAKDAHRPFVVKVAGTEVVATGTTFVLQFVPRSKAASDSLAVTLVEGQVVVRDAASSAPGTAFPRPVVMAAGERMRLHPSGGAAKPGVPTIAPQVDRPRMDQLLAWKRGEAVFDNVSMLEAVAEMNRYSSTPIKVAGASAQGSLRVSGIFRTGDNASFARAMVALHGLVLRERPDGLELVSK